MVARDGASYVAHERRGPVRGEIMKQKPINQQVVVVMGASSGIGRATALRFAARGAAVVAAARNRKGLDTVVAGILEGGGKAVAIVADTADAKQVKAVADGAVAEFGRIDTWAHVAGVGVYGTVEQITPEEYERLIEVNLLGQIYGALAALPHLRATGRGTLIHVSSVEGRVAYALSSGYAASKHGMIGFLDALRLELEREGVPIAVVNIMPAAIDTPFFEAARTHLGVAPRPPDPVYAPEIVAEAIVDAAEHPMRDIVVGGAGAGAIAAKRLAPRLLHEVLLTPSGFEAQLTTRPRSPNAPDNLFTPTPDELLRVHGQATAISKRTSLYTRIATSASVRLTRELSRPLLRLMASAVGALWAARYGKAYRGITLRSGPGAGLPDPVVKQMDREGVRETSAVEPEDEGPRAGRAREG